MVFGFGACRKMVPPQVETEKHNLKERYAFVPGSVEPGTPEGYLGGVQASFVCLGLEHKRMTGLESPVHRSQMQKDNVFSYV